MIVTIIRTVILYVFVTIGIRLMGKRQIGDMQPNELVITILISEIAAIPLQDMSQPILNGIIAIFVLVILEILISVLSMKNIHIRNLLSGKSAVVIKNGVIDQQAMRRVRMTVLDLVELLRGQSVFDLSTVAFAVLEVNGDLSVLLKSGDQPATARDVSAKKDPAALPLPVISDGTVLEDSLRSLGISRDELDKLLAKKRTSVDRVFLMTIDRNRNANIINVGEKNP